MQNAMLACPAPSGGGAEGDGVVGGGGAGVVMVKRAALVACLTFPLCRRLLRDATTITECLHTFCRKCISKEIIDKEICYCPRRNIDLGCAPEEKLRIDHSLKYVRSKILPSKIWKVVDQEAISPVESPVKRKERSLSSLTVHGPRVSIQKCLTMRRTKPLCLRSLFLLCSFCFDFVG
uniref:Zinc finger C3HC4 RING-type domain-containing protein n=1 Tax=Aegilops tauschii subsp. strangulata TaxID=200361 RepID=A0A453CM72_AEGTS